MVLIGLVNLSCPWRMVMLMSRRRGLRWRGSISVARRKWWLLIGGTQVTAAGRRSYRTLGPGSWAKCRVLLVRIVGTIVVGVSGLTVAVGHRTEMHSLLGLCLMTGASNDTLSWVPVGHKMGALLSEEQQTRPRSYSALGDHWIWVEWWQVLKQLGWGWGEGSGRAAPH